MNIMQLKKASTEMKTYIPFDEIKNEDDYLLALELMEDITDDYDDSLSIIIDILAPKIEAYENKLPELKNFNKRIASLEPGASTLRLLMEHHHLKTTDFKDEIGVKSVVSMISTGKRELTAKQIKKLSIRFNISPSLFFNH